MAVLIPSPNFSTIPSLQSNPFVTGFNITITGSTTFTVSPGSARALTSGYIIAYPAGTPNMPANIAVDVSTVGAGGCYPHSIASLALANDTLMGVYVVANSSGTTGGSLNPNIAASVIVATGDNFLPSNYDSFCRIGFVYIDSGTGNLIWMSQSGNGNERTYILNAGPAAVSAGNATTSTSLDLTSGDGVVPPGAGTLVYLGLTLNGNAAGAYVRLFPTGNLTGNGSAGAITPVATQTLGVADEMVTGVATNGDASINYLVNNTGTTTTIIVQGFVDSLGASLF